MADTLGAAAWTGYTRKHKLELEDAGFVKALTRFDKAGTDDHPARLEALEAVIEQARKLVVWLAKQKKALGDKVFDDVKAKIYELHDQAEALQKKVRADAQAAAADDDEEEETPALLTTKMVPLLRQVRKGTAQMHALICTAGKNTAVLVMRRAIAPSRRKLLAQAVDAAGGAKYIVGECLLEDGAVTFVVQSAAGGLAKRVRTALLAQTEMRLRVRVRGQDGEQDQDGEDDDTPPAGASVGQPAPAASGGPQAPPHPTPEALAYEQKRLKIEDRLAQALRAQHPEATKLRALMGFASEKADGQQDHAAAIKALDMLDKLLTVQPAGRAGAEQGVDPAAAFTARLAALMPRIKEALAAARPAAQDIKLKTSEAGTLARKQSHDAAHALLDEVESLLGGGAGTGAASAGAAAQAVDAMAIWQGARTRAVTALKGVATRIAGARHASSTKAVIEIQAVVKNLSAGPLSLQQVNELQRYLGEDEVVNDVCELAEDIRTPLLQALGRVREQLGA